jgi:hypothetical protein
MLWQIPVRYCHNRSCKSLEMSFARCLVLNTACKMILGECMCHIFRPCRGSIVYPMLPTAHAVGYNIPPLPGLGSGTGKSRLDQLNYIEGYSCEPAREAVRLNAKDDDARSLLAEILEDAARPERGRQYPKAESRRNKISNSRSLNLRQRVGTRSIVCKTASILLEFSCGILSSQSSH